MRAVKSADTKPEMTVRRMAFSMGYRYRLHRKELPGKPDLVFTRRRKVIFVHGCFWHGHDCSRGARIPKHNKEYWIAKIGKNTQRDASNQLTLKKMGWTYLVLWECGLKDVIKLRNQLHDFLEPNT
jgi:DNA mismatch endonuclease (patch repair protein)